VPGQRKAILAELESTSETHLSLGPHRRLNPRRERLLAARPRYGVSYEKNRKKERRINLKKRGKARGRHENTTQHHNEGPDNDGTPMQQTRKMGTVRVA